MGWSGAAGAELDDFPKKLDLILKGLSLSRGRLAASLGVDKSLVSRWASGTNSPSAHNLAELTRLIAERQPGFTLLDWDADIPALAARYGLPAPDLLAGAPSAEPIGGDRLLAASRAQSAVEVRREGAAYTGIWVGFYQAFRNTGQVIPELICIWRQGDRLLFREFNLFFSHIGEMLIIRHQIFMVGEDDTRVDGLLYLLLNGVGGEKAVRIDGLAMSVFNGRFRAPGASPVVLQRLADLEDEAAPPDEAAVNAILDRLRAAHFADETPTLAGPAILEAVRPRVGAPRDDGEIDHLLRSPEPRSLAACEVEWNPTLEADVRRLRLALLGVDDCFPIAADYGVRRAAP